MTTERKTKRERLAAIMAEIDTSQIRELPPEWPTLGDDQVGSLDVQHLPGGLRKLSMADRGPRRPHHVFLRQFFNRGPSKH